MDPANLIFVIAPPRSGSTLLQRMLGSHSQIHTHPEPHLIVPLYHLGYHATVNTAPYDHINAAEAMREFVASLPGGEEDYLDSLRAYAITLYGRALGPSGKQFFVDKTPANALVLPFLTKVFPEARYVVLTRHPVAILHSVTHSFFAGDYTRASRDNPVITDYVPAIADLLREATVPHIHLRYEELVDQPAEHMQKVAAFLGLPFESAMVTYGEQEHVTKSFGDPFTVNKHTRPVTDSVARWASDLAARPDAAAVVRGVVDKLDTEDLRTWGFDKTTLLDPSLQASPSPTDTGSLHSYRLKRQILLALRKNIHHNTLGALVKKIRYYCDVLLRA